MPDAKAVLRRSWPPLLVAHFLRTGRLPDTFVVALLAWFQSERTHTGVAVVDLSLGGGDISPTRLASIEENWRDGERAYGGQDQSDFFAA